jgi:threonine/homoserine/homoserine lactone efflux protein
MNLKLTAALQTAGILVVTSTIAVGIQLLFTTLTAKELTNLLAIGSITFLIYCMYQVVLSRLEYEQKVEEIAQK